MGSAIIVAAITYGAGLLTLLVAVHVVVCVGTGLGSIPTVSYGATVRHRPDSLDGSPPVLLLAEVVPLQKTVTCNPVSSCSNKYEEFF